MDQDYQVTWHHLLSFGRAYDDFLGGGGGGSGPLRISPRQA
jgi:hypothetical protein